MEDERYDYVAAIIEYEDGGLELDGVVKLFAHLIRTGTVWALQGRYGRTAQAMIEHGLIDAEGNIDNERLEEVMADV